MEAQRRPKRTESLTFERANELLSYNLESGVLTWKVRRGSRGKAGAVAGWDKKSNNTTYRQVMIDGVSYLAHRTCWLLATGAFPHNDIDHRDGDGLNNHLENLRDVTRSINLRNQKRSSNNTSGITGVRVHSQHHKWSSQIGIAGRNKHLGYYDDLQDAAAARKAAERLHGYSENHGRAPIAAQTGGF